MHACMHTHIIDFLLIKSTRVPINVLKRENLEAIDFHTNPTISTIAFNDITT